MSKNEILNSSLSTLSSEPRMLNRSLRIAKPPKSPNPSLQNPPHPHRAAPGAPGDPPGSVLLLLLFSTFSIFFVHANVQAYMHAYYSDTHIYMLHTHIHIHMHILCIYIYMYIDILHIHYLMAAANAADPKTGRKTEAERPAVSPCTGRS